MKNNCVFVLVCSLFYGVVQAQGLIPALRKQAATARADSSRSRLFYELGRHYGEQNLDSAFYFLNQSLTLAQQGKDLYATARAMYGLGFSYLYYQQNENLAMQWLKKAVTIAQNNKDYVYLAKSYQLLGVIAMHQGIGNPHDFFEEAVTYAQKSKDWRTIMDTYEVISNVYQNREKYEEAAKFILKAMDVCKEHDIDCWLSSGLDYCDMLEKQNKRAEARSFAKMLYAYKEQLKQTKGYFVYMNDLGRLETKLEKYTQAEAIFEKVLAYEKQKPKVDTFHLYFIFRNLKDLYAEQRSFEKAFRVANELTEIRLWLAQKRQTRDSQLQMTQLKSAYDLEKKEREITLLAKQKREQQIVLIAAAVVAVLLISFVVVLQRNNQRIERQKTELTALNTTKDKLFAILSHDLRSPVAGLKNYLMLTDWGVLTQAEFADSTKNLTVQLNNVHTMLDNVLNWSLSQMRGIRPKRETTDMASIIEDEIELLLPMAQTKNIQIVNDISANVQIMIDRNHAAVIFRNLLQNALKFTHSGGKIRLSYSKEKDMHQFVIEDTGVGMSEERLQNLFQLNKTTSQMGTAREQGTGVGLVLVKELVGANQGTLSVVSELNQGTIFTLELRH
ncbi:tetratricopeptide repeat protein [Runella sp. CRIBMP]|uniref:tetratricopeptide repeat-containing sensor histidine kinase n=1 Tax=Runella sp. CRIBMP TaxID=2683261 RepID=UPI001412B342|nr:ATP-binding protein [Runella sp. CRIBMP]NBB21551.1 tetratricopeptide repeat protein [Runella sp. CRIBMP]